MPLVDTKTGKPWPMDMANLKLNDIRETCRDDLMKRDKAVGIDNGKLTTTIADPNVDGKTKEVVDPVKQRLAHTGAEMNTLLAKRWAEYCSEPHDLDAFIASTRTPEAVNLQAAKDAAEPIEESLTDPSLHIKRATQVPDMGEQLEPTTATTPEPEPEEKPRRGPGRPRKNPVEV